MKPGDEVPPELDLEDDSRFPSGPWKGFFLQPELPGRHWMEIDLTFRRGTLRGEGRDWVGSFHFRGRYEVETGKCWWIKQYIGRHAISYQGYNEGKGIWGTWEWTHTPPWRGGFHIWPVAMGDPTRQTLAEELDEPVPIESESLEITTRLRTGLTRRKTGRSSQGGRRERAHREEDGKELTRRKTGRSSQGGRRERAHAEDAEDAERKKRGRGKREEEGETFDEIHSNSGSRESGPTPEYPNRDH